MMLPAGVGRQGTWDRREAPFGVGARQSPWRSLVRMTNFGPLEGETLMDRREEEFVAIVGRIGDVEHRWYRRVSSRLAQSSSSAPPSSGCPGPCGARYGGRRPGCRLWRVPTSSGLGSCAVGGGGDVQPSHADRADRATPSFVRPDRGHACAGPGPASQSILQQQRFLGVSRNRRPSVAIDP